MSRLSARSNPTGLKEISRNQVSVTVSELSGKRGFTLDRLDLSNAGIPEDEVVVVIAKAGNTTMRYEMGTVGSRRRERKLLDGLDQSQPLRFRVLIHRRDESKLTASVENLRPRDDEQSESLLPMEPAELAERIWKVLITDDGPVLQFNSTVFPSAAGAENYLPFSAMVLPEALLHVMRQIAEDPERLDDDSDPWSAWAPWLAGLGVDRPPDDEEARDSWCHSVVDQFCGRFGFASRLQGDLLKGAEDA